MSFVSLFIMLESNSVLKVVTHFFLFPCARTEFFKTSIELFLRGIFNVTFNMMILM